MNRIGWMLVGLLLPVAAAAIGGSLFLSGSHGFSARDQPSALERWIAVRARRAALPAEARSRLNPIQNSSQVLAEARAHWADHCSGCHANDGSGEALLGKRTYPPAPDMRLAETQKLSDGELFYIIQNGIRLTAMPAWGGGASHDEADSWKLVHFIRHLPDLSFDEKKEMERLNPKSPDDLKEEEEEQKFLRGEESEPQEHHHH